jgi:hypothetical protein
MQKMYRVGCATRTEPATLLIEERNYDTKTPDRQFDDDADILLKALKHLPCGTLDRMIQLMLGEEIREYQLLGKFDLSEKFLAVSEIYAQRLTGKDI